VCVKALVAGMAIPEARWVKGAKPCWSGYIATNDVDTDAACVEAARGAIKRAPEDIPNDGRFDVAADPGEDGVPALQAEHRGGAEGGCADAGWH
jgi:uncharacterized protein